MEKISPAVRAKFKIKIKSLAEESRIIRAHIHSLGRQWARMDGPRDGQYEWQTKRYHIAVTQTLLNDHRIVDVRHESRHTLLAYAYLRGVPYRAVEPRATMEPCEPAIARIVGSIGGRQHNGVSVSISEWIRADVARVA